MLKNQNSGRLVRIEIAATAMAIWLMVTARA